MNNEQKLLRSTHQRQLVLDVVKASKDHPVADVIYERAREKNPTISKATVYRNLNLLAELGEIRRLSMPYGADHFDFNLDKHYHSICRMCCRVDDVSLEYDEKFNSVDTGTGFVTDGHRLILTGLCHECNKKMKRGN